MSDVKLGALNEGAWQVTHRRHLSLSPSLAGPSRAQSLSGSQGAVGGEAVDWGLRSEDQVRSEGRRWWVGLLENWLPAQGEAVFVEALHIGPTELLPGEDVPAASAVELLQLLLSCLVPPFCEAGGVQQGRGVPSSIMVHQLAVLVQGRGEAGAEDVLGQVDGEVDAGDEDLRHVRPHLAAELPDRSLDVVANWPRALVHLSAKAASRDDDQRQSVLKRLPKGGDRRRGVDGQEGLRKLEGSEQRHEVNAHDVHSFEDARIVDPAGDDFTLACTILLPRMHPLQGRHIQRVPRAECGGLQPSAPISTATGSHGRQGQEITTIDYRI
mmetsp:Transcript_11251/g.24368  ORF Transcript_11251/g.24368 Transcript_11251/m.24368 type:complete len:326 (+) Transcript_11251:60-1037(+)